MTDDNDANGRTDSSVQRTESANLDTEVSFTRREWENLPTDPDLIEDLGYHWSDWEQFETLDGTDQLMFLPTDEEALKDAAFVVAECDTVVDLGEHC